MKHHYKSAITQLRHALSYQSYGSTIPLSWRQCCRMRLSVLRGWIEKLEGSLILWGPYSKSIEDEDGEGVRTYIARQWRSPWARFDPSDLARHYHADTVDGLSKSAQGTGHLFCALLKLLWVREFAQAKHEARPLPELMCQPLVNRRHYSKGRQKRGVPRQLHRSAA